MRIVYATDGSPGALAAAELLTALTLESDDTVTILTVAAADRHAEGQRMLDAARAALSHCTAGVTAQFHTGHPAQEILRAVEEPPAELLVMGASGRSGLARFFIGSVAERVARHATCPVFIARPLQGELREVVAGVDGSPAAARAVSWLQRFPLPEAAAIRLVTVLPRLEELTRTSRLLPLPLMSRDDAAAFIEREREETQAGLDQLAASFSEAGCRVITDIRRGDPATALLEAAEEEGAALIAVGSHGHSAVERFLMGSVSERLLRHAPCSVLIVR